MVAQAGALLDSEAAPGADPHKEALGVRLDTLSAKLLEDASRCTRRRMVRPASTERARRRRQGSFGNADPVRRSGSRADAAQDGVAGLQQRCGSTGAAAHRRAGHGQEPPQAEFLHELGASRKACTLLLGQGDPFWPERPLRFCAARCCGSVGCTAASPEVMQRDLRRRLTAHLPPADHDRVSQFLSVLCRCPLTDEGSPLLQAARQDPKIMRAELGRAIEDWLRAESAVSPILIVLDDLQVGRCRDR